MKIKHLQIFAALAVLLVGGTVRADEPPPGGYRLQEPPSFPIFNTATPNAWQQENCKSLEWASGGSAKLNENGDWPRPSDNDASTDDNYLLAESQIASPFDHVQPDHYLGDRVAPPDGIEVDWDATFAALKLSDDYLDGRIIFEPSVHAIIFVQGGTLNIDWKKLGGGTVHKTYEVSSSPASRPYRIYWTEHPFNGPQVNLSGKFVKLYGDPDIVDPVVEKDPDTGVSTVTRGLYLDPSTQWLRAIGDITGHVVMVYYATGSFETYLSHIVIEVCRPEVKTVPADIGSELLPVGDGFNPKGLTPLVTAGLNAADGRGAYIYQHKGAHHYSPKDGSVFALRKTVGKPWEIEIYWEQRDAMDTLWPFELLHYECDWPEDAELFVRDVDGDDPGTTVRIPKAYTSTLCEFQEPAGHASLDNGVLTTTKEGHCLLELRGTDANGSDNVWFQAVHSISRKAPSFDLTPNEWTVGTEVVPLKTSVALGFEGDGCVDTAIDAFAGSFTVEGWVWRRGDGQQELFTSAPDTPGDDPSKQDFSVYFMEDGRVGVQMGSGDSATPYSLNLSSTTTVPTKKWVHVAFSYDDGGKKAVLCINGKAEATATMDGGFSRQYAAGYNIALGAFVRDGAGYGPFLDGQMDDVRFWSVARTAGQIAANMTGFLHTAADETDLVAYYPVDNTSGRKLPDHGGKGRDAAMTNVIRVSPGAVGLRDLAGFSAGHGYIHKGANYNANLYVPPDEMTSADETPGEEAKDESYIFGVNESGKDDMLEVWWSHKVDQQAMPEPLWFPAWVQNYRFEWPQGDHGAPEIVLTSQLGSAGESTVCSGVGLDLSVSSKSFMKIPEGDWFKGDAFTVEAWIKPQSATPDRGRVFNFQQTAHTNNILMVYYGDNVETESKRRTLGFEVWDAGGVGHTLSTTSKLALGDWHHVVGVFDHGTLSLYLDGQLQAQTTGVPSLDASLPDNALGAYLGADGNTGFSSFDGVVDEFRIWSVAQSAEEISSGRFTPPSADAEGLLLWYDFDSDREGSPDAHYAYDRVGNAQGTIRNADWALPGAPRLDTGVIVTAEDEAPVIYYQNDNTRPGFNPNEEHAFVRASEGGYVTYALRNDLNTESTSKPYVLVQYNDPAMGGHPNMKVYQVLASNDRYPDFAGTMTAGTTVPGPHPLDFLPDPWVLETYWEYADGQDADSCPGYKDRKGQVWAKNAGPGTDSTTLLMHNYYPMQEGFFFPGMAEQPALGTAIPWLGKAEGNDGKPQLWTWTVEWPEVAAELDIGQTLTKAIDDLPEVWNARSMSVIHQPAQGAVALYDPIVVQAAKLEFNGNFMEAFSFDYADDARSRNGFTYLLKTPPNVSGRFYYDPTAPPDSNLRLVGRLVEHTGGLSFLQLNVLSDAERTALKGLVDKTNANKAQWDAAVEGLATARVATDVEKTYTTAKAYPDSPYSAGAGGSVTVTDSIPVVHYALTHMGKAQGFVTLIENDARDPACGVQSGDPINMHIVRLTPDLYAGPILPLEDPENLLSEQLDILYTESFAGDANDFEFEWKRAEPNANGTTPTDYDNQYSTWLFDTGVTRFTIGKEGDTLDNMVNNFYVMRYRARKNTDAYDLSGGVWSDWCGPTLAEGWVERVLNNITPFTQRMQDLYTNEAETRISMIQQAGPPYQGDVALNQDNLDKVGLIQLYQTILNKAESMSLTLGIDNTAANQQLMYAATRLNDLYMLLGNEAYADAMDPTIGFGNSFDNKMPGYGSMHSSLFCFDNMVPNLREEELALLRGRSDDLAPSLHTPPTYNRLYWNFTKGVTAGEVAYAVNYQVQGDAVTIDQQQAAALYPQGHGDAWGHYLSALYGYYRLLRNPYFSWGTPSITPLMVGDAVVDADYFDEEKFVESAAAMARTGEAVVTLTCEKAFAENGGTPLAGYRDKDSTRAFGYGEWGARAGMAALYNWMTGNSLLPAQVDPLSYEQLDFTPSTELVCDDPPDGIDFTGDFTIEFKIKTDASLAGSTDDCRIFDWTPAGGTREDDGAVSLRFNPAGGWLRLDVKGLPNEMTMELPAPGEWNHVAIVYSSADHELRFYLNGVRDTSCSACTSITMPAEVALANPVITLAANDSPLAFKGLLAEFRIWNDIRTPEELVAYADGVSARADGLQSYQRFISDSDAGGRLPDEASSSVWVATNPAWQSQERSGVALDFSDESILRINRSSVGALREIPAAMAAVQRRVDEADAGVTPVGLSGNAIPFDLDPLLFDHGAGHFEQILSRAETALGNAETLLDRAQTVSRLRRRQEQSAYNLSQELANEEFALDTALIGIFGYPYSDDIGAGGIYPQGYNGPDLYHYMYMDLEQYGFKSIELEEAEVKSYEVMKLDQVGEPKDSETVTLDFSLAPNGMVLKPESIKGTRRAQGRLQQSYGEFLAAYQAYRKAYKVFDTKEEIMEKEANWFEAKAATLGTLESLEAVAAVSSQIYELKKLKDEVEINVEDISGKDFTELDYDEIIGLPKFIVAGMSVGTDIGAPIRAAIGDETYASYLTSNEILLKAKIEMAIDEAKHKMWVTAWEKTKDIANLTFEEHEMTAELSNLVAETNEAGMSLQVAYAGLLNAQQAHLSVLAEGQRLLAKREQLRTQWVNRIGVGRYHDMAYRSFRYDALSKYDNAFDLAKKYTYLAAKAYDYETALDLDDVYEPSSLFREITGIRCIGHLEDGVPQLGGGVGDGGLADVLARLKSNWLTLEGRLGINNAQVERNWVSLRHELFRIPDSGADAEIHWQNELSKCRVDNLLENPDFRRYCLPFNSSEGLQGAEPGLVIPFRTTIDFAYNLFGLPLAANDHAFDSSHYATRIRKVGVKFVGYNKVVGDAGSVELSVEPRVYLIPVGRDIMRTPGGDLLSYSVVDQVVPAPFPLAGQNLDETDWTTLYDSYLGNGEPLATIRRYPSLRAYTDQYEFEDDMISSSRLIGRSVWNTRWLLIIPAGTLLSDREAGLDAFIRGADVNRDGTRDQLGVQDIEIGFETYATSGN